MVQLLRHFARMAPRCTTASAMMQYTPRTSMWPPRSKTNEIRSMSSRKEFGRGTDTTKREVVLAQDEKRVINSTRVKTMEGYSFLTTTWTDGTSFDFPFMFLRDNCQCPACFDHSSGQRKVYIETICDETKGETSISAAGGLQITWMDGHQSEFSAEWLSERLPGAATQRDLRHEEPIAWSAADMQKNLPRHSHAAVMQDGNALRACVRDLWVFGLAVLHGAPARRGVVQELADRMSLTGMLATNYGTSFDVQAKPHPSNLAYTPVELPLHSDLVQYERKPQIQVLHCIAQAAEGGANTFIDGLQVTRAFQQAHAEAFRVLCEEEVLFADQGTDESGRFELRNQAPLIQHDRRGRFASLNFNNHIRGSFMLQAPARWARAFAAWRLFAHFMRREEFVLRLRLESGDLVLFDNLRTLHGRTQLGMPPPGAGAARHLQGCYLDWDNVLSAYRTAL